MSEKSEERLKELLNGLVSEMQNGNISVNYWKIERENYESSDSQRLLDITIRIKGRSK